jgi:hypothetical protein
LANNLEDLNNLDEKHFVLTKEVYKFMKKHYNYGFMGFVVCKLVLGNKEYHPIAYSHNIYKKKIFIPTKHFHMHDNNIGAFNSFDHYGFMSDVLIDKPKTIDDGSYADDWHHDIYIYNGNIGKNAKLDEMIKKTINDPKGSAGIRYEWSKDITFDFDKIDFNLSKKCHEFQKFQISKFAKIRNPTQDLLVVCVAKRLIPLDQRFIYQNNKSENLNLNRDHLGQFLSVLSKSILANVSTFYNCFDFPSKIILLKITRNGILKCYGAFKFSKRINKL